MNIAEENYCNEVARLPPIGWKPPDIDLPKFHWPTELPERDNHVIMWAISTNNRELIIQNTMGDFRAIAKDKMCRLVKSGLDPTFFNDDFCEEIWQVIIERIYANLPYVLEKFNPTVYFLQDADTYLRSVYRRVKKGESIDTVTDELAINGLLFDFLNRMVFKAVDDIKNERTSFAKKIKGFSPRRAGGRLTHYQQYYSRVDRDLDYSDNESVELTKHDYDIWKDARKSDREWDLLMDALGATSHSHRSRLCIDMMLHYKNVGQIGSALGLGQSQVYEVINGICRRASEYGKVAYAPDPKKEPEPEFVRKPPVVGRQKIPYT